MAFEPSQLWTNVGDGPAGVRGNSVNYQHNTGRPWTYVTEDAIATVRGASYFATARLNGVVLNDTVLVLVLTAGVVTAGYQSAFTSQSDDAFTMATGVQVI